MTDTLIELTEEEFDRRFALIPNHINPTAGWASGDAGGCLFETFGDEFEFVKRQDPSRVWTLLDGEDGDMYVVNGLRYVNRLGYLVSACLVPASTAFQVHIPMQRDDQF